MKIWHYNTENGELIGEGTADPNPLVKDEWLHPAFSTPAEPPEARPSCAVIWVGGGWTYTPDHRGETWWKADAEFNTAPVRIDFLGDPAAAGLTNVEPPSPPLPAAPPATPEQIRALLVSMGKTPEEVDALFALAKSL